MICRPHATNETADILTYVPQETYNAILLREVIYCLPVAEVSGFLDGYWFPGARRHDRDPGLDR